MRGPTVLPHPFIPLNLDTTVASKYFYNINRRDISRGGGGGARLRIIGPWVPQDRTEIGQRPDDISRYLPARPHWEIPKKGGETKVGQ